MTTRPRQWILVAVAAVQLAVPLSLIGHWEFILRRGDVYRFLTAPVDPYDAFRGRYVALRMAAEDTALAAPRDVANNERVYARLAVDAEGFAYFNDVTTDRPVGGAYLAARTRYGGGTNLHLNLPIDRFYMKEELAPEAERAYAQQSRGTNLNAHVALRVWRGKGVVEDLYVDDLPIHEFLAREQARQP